MDGQPAAAGRRRRRSDRGEGDVEEQPAVHNGLPAPASPIDDSLISAASPPPPSAGVTSAEPLGPVDFIRNALVANYHSVGYSLVITVVSLLFLFLNAS